MGGSDKDAKAPKSKVRILCCCWSDLLFGKACCIYNVLFSPCVLTFWACAIYMCGCVEVVLRRAFYTCCCCICRKFNCCWLFTDKRFPPDDASLGSIGGDSANEDSGKSNANVTWLRANNMSKSGTMQLFGDTIDSRDICQGALGNCWLLAAMACMAEHKGAITSVFRTKERNPKGKYKLRLYDGVKEKWEMVTIDDHIPCDKAAYKRNGTYRPIFSQPNGNELYAMLMEKAFAKFCGTYAATEGGQTIWAIRAMTGDPARWFMRDDDMKGWKRFDLVNVHDPKNRRACNLKSRGETIDNETMFETLRKYHCLQSILCASGSSGADGLHKGHAYSILDVRHINTGMMGFGGEDIRLVKVRNPWGQGEWSGDWGDKSPKWAKYPSVKQAVGFQDADDGAFWMSWDDYVKNWNKIGVVDRTIDIHSLRLHVANDKCCAPVAGCCKGCCRFWCCCEGPRYLYFPHHSSDETVKVKKRCCAIM